MMICCLISKSILIVQRKGIFASHEQSAKTKFYFLPMHLNVRRDAFNTIYFPKIALHTVTQLFSNNNVVRVVPVGPFCILNKESRYNKDEVWGSWGHPNTPTWQIFF